MNAFYAVIAVVLFIVEVLIALFVRDGFVRGYVGDVLALMLVYAVLRAAMRLRVMAAVTVALAIALAIEIAQAFDLLGMLGLGDNQLARTVLGGSFDLLDIVAYMAGAAAVIALELMFGSRGRQGAG